MKKYLKYISYLGAGTLAIFAGIFVASEKSEMVQAGAPGEKKNTSCTYRVGEGTYCWKGKDICVDGAEKNSHNSNNEWELHAETKGDLLSFYTTEMYLKNKKTGEKKDVNNTDLINGHCHDWDCINNCSDDNGDGGSSYEEYEEYQD